MTVIMLCNAINEIYYDTSEGICLIAIHSVCVGG